MSEHAKLVAEAKEALDAVFGDRSVGKTQTLSSLEELSGDLEIQIDALQEEIDDDEDCEDDEDDTDFEDSDLE